MSRAMNEISGQQARLGYVLYIHHLHFKRVGEGVG